MRKICLICLCVLLLGILPLHAQEDNLLAEGLRPDFEDDLARFPNIPQYTANLRLAADFERATIDGQIAIRYTNMQADPLPDIVLRLYPNLPSFGGNVVLSNVTIDGVPIEPDLDATRSVADLVLAQPLAPGNTIEIAMDYIVEVRYGQERLYNLFSYLEKELAMPSFLPLLSVYEPVTGWWQETDHVQGDAVFSEIANFDVTLTYPEYLKVITSGSEVENAPGTEAETVTSRYVAPLMRDFSLMASSEYATLSGSAEDIAVNIHYLPGHEEEAELALGWTLDAVAAYTEDFGEYAYRELDIVETHTTAGGIEYPGMVVVADRLWATQDNLYFQVVVVHEIAHQWWYSLVGSNQVRFPWLDESLTNYSVALYYDYTQGETAYQAVLSAYGGQYTEYLSNADDLPIGESANAYPEGAYSPIVYGKGGLFYGAIADEVGKENLLAGLHQYFEAYKYRVATPIDLQTTLENAMDTELDDLFITWVGYSN